MSSPANSDTISFVYTSTSGHGDDETWFQGQRASVQWSARFHSLLLRAVKPSSDSENDQEEIEVDTTVQERLIEEMRDGLSNNDIDADTNVKDASHWHSRALLCVSSLRNALHRCNQSSAMRPSYYAQLLDTLSWEWSELLLHGLEIEWCRIVSQQPELSEQDAQSDPPRSTVMVTESSISSPLLESIMSLLKEIAQHSNAREFGLNLLGFWEMHVLTQSDGEVASQPNQHESSDALEQERMLSSPYRRLSLALPLLDLIGTLLPQLAQPKLPPAAAAPTSAPSTNPVCSSPSPLPPSDATATVAASPSAAPRYGVRELDIIQQMTRMCTRTSSDILSQLSLLQAQARRKCAQTKQRLDASSANNAIDHGENVGLSIWRRLYLEYTHKCIRIIRPQLQADPFALQTLNTARQAMENIISSSSAATSTATHESNRTSQPAPSSITPRSILLSFLFSSLHSFLTNHPALHPESSLQQIWEAVEGRSSGVAAKGDNSGLRPTATQSDRSHSFYATSPSSPNPSSAVSSQSPSNSLIVLFEFCSTINSARLSLGELRIWYELSHSVARKIEQLEDEELAAGGWSEEEDEQESEDGSDDDDDASLPKPSALELLRKIQASLPTYDTVGVGCWMSVTLIYHDRRKNMHEQSTQEQNELHQESPSQQQQQHQPVEKLLLSLPSLDFPLFPSSMPPHLLLDSCVPFLVALLQSSIHSFGSLSISEDGVQMGGGGGDGASPSSSLSLQWLATEFANGLCHLIPSGSICLLPNMTEKTGEEMHDASIQRSSAWMLSETLLQSILVVAAPPIPAAASSSSAASLAQRSTLLSLWKGLLATLCPSSRAQFLWFLIRHSMASNIRALAMTRLKEEIHQHWWNKTDDATSMPHRASGCDASTPTNVCNVDHGEFLTSSWLESFYTTLSDACQQGILESIDFLIAAANFFRYLLLRDRADADSEAGSRSLTSATNTQIGGAGSRLGLRQPSQRQQWADRWRAIQRHAEMETDRLEQQIHQEGREQQQRQVQGTGAPPMSEGMLLRNQMQMTVELCRMIVGYLQQDVN